MDIAFSKDAPAITLGIPKLITSYSNLLKKGGKIRCITEITRDNIEYCKCLQEYVTELRHLDGIKGCIVTNDDEYMATALIKPNEVVSHAIYSTYDELLEQGQYIFDTFWENSISFSKRSKIIEEGLDQIKTRILTETKDISQKLIEIARESRYLKVYSSVEGLRLSSTQFSGINKRILKEYRNKNHDGYFWIVSLENKSDLDIAKGLLREGFKIKHSDNKPFINFIVSDKSFASSFEKLKGDKMVSNLLVSNDPLYMEHFNMVFDDLWNSAIEIIQREKEIIHYNYLNTRTISSVVDALKLTAEYYTFSTEEILIIIPSFNGLLRLINSKELNILTNIANNRIVVKILMIYDKGLDFLKELKLQYPNIEFKKIHIDIHMSHRIIIIDRSKTIIWKIKDDKQPHIVDAIGIATFIENKSISLAYYSMFDTLWIQLERFNRLKEIYQQDNEPNKNQIIFNNSVTENGQKLYSLTENMLDLSKIEENLFNMKFRKFDLFSLLSNTKTNFDNMIKKNGLHLLINFLNTDIKNITIEADKDRIEQVINNLINNSIKSISMKEKRADTPPEYFGKILISVEKRKADIDNVNREINNNIKKIKFDKNLSYLNHEQMLNRNKDIIIVSILDNGEVIDPKLIQDLFGNFLKSVYDNELSLYISKKIVEAHGGRMWANNLENKNWIIFSFSLPLKTI